MLLGSASSYWLVVKVSKFMDTHFSLGNCATLAEWDSDEASKTYPFYFSQHGESFASPVCKRLPTLLNRPNLSGNTHLSSESF